MSVKCNENGNDEKKGWMAGWLAGSSGSGYTMDHRRPKTEDLRSGLRTQWAQWAFLVPSKRLTLNRMAVATVSKYLNTSWPPWPFCENERTLF